LIEDRRVLFGIRILIRGFHVAVTDLGTCPIRQGDSDETRRGPTKKDNHRREEKGIVRVHPAELWDPLQEGAGDRDDHLRGLRGLRRARVQVRNARRRRHPVDQRHRHGEGRPQDPGEFYQELRRQDANGGPVRGLRPQGNPPRSLPTPTSQ
jgi:hypothetical protein